MNGCGASRTYFLIPRAMRRSVASASGFLRVKIDGHGMLQSMHSAAVRNGCARPGPWVGCGQAIASPSQRAMMKRRLRLVGAPKSLARSCFSSTW